MCKPYKYVQNPGKTCLRTVNALFERCAPVYAHQNQIDTTRSQQTINPLYRPLKFSILWEKITSRGGEFLSSYFQRVIYPGTQQCDKFTAPKHRVLLRNLDF